MSGSNGKRINSTASTRRYSSYPAEEKQEAKVTYLTEFELNNQPNIIRNGSSELHNGNNNLVKHSDMSIVEQSIGNIHHSSSSSNTTTSATLNNSNSSSRHHMRSEDELSAVSTSKTIFPIFVLSK